MSQPIIFMTAKFLASIPSPFDAGQRDAYNRQARAIVAIDDMAGEYVKTIDFYHSEVAKATDDRFSRIMDEDAALIWGYID